MDNLRERSVLDKRAEHCVFAFALTGEKGYTMKTTSYFVLAAEDIHLQRNQVEQITDRMRADIQSGKLGPFNALPTRRAMAEQFRTTVDTISKVLHNLEIEGFIVKGKGRAMRVNTPRTRVTTNEEIFRDVMATAGHNVQVEYIKTPGVVSASPEIARIFRVPEGTPLIERMRRENVDGRIYRYSRKIYLASLISAEHFAAMQNDRTYNVREVIEEQHPLSRIEERFFARVIAEKDEAVILGAVKGAPVLEQWKINYDQERRILWISIIVFNAAYFEKRFDYVPGDEPKLSSFLMEGNY